jgi:hypothetical protein
MKIKFIDIVTQGGYTANTNEVYFLSLEDLYNLVNYGDLLKQSDFRDRSEAISPLIPNHYHLSL